MPARVIEKTILCLSRAPCVSPVCSCVRRAERIMNLGYHNRKFAFRVPILYTLIRRSSGTPKRVKHRIRDAESMKMINYENKLIGTLWVKCRIKVSRSGHVVFQPGKPCPPVQQKTDRKNNRNVYWSGWCVLCSKRFVLRSDKLAKKTCRCRG